MFILYLNSWNYSEKILSRVIQGISRSHENNNCKISRYYTIVVPLLLEQFNISARPPVLLTPSTVDFSSTLFFKVIFANASLMGNRQLYGWFCIREAHIATAKISCSRRLLVGNPWCTRACLCLQHKCFLFHLFVFRWSCTCNVYSWCCFVIFFSFRFIRLRDICYCFLSQHLVFFPFDFWLFSSPVIIIFLLSTALLLLFMICWGCCCCPSSSSFLLLFLPLLLLPLLIITNILLVLCVLPNRMR